MLSLLVVLVGLGNSVPFGGKARTNRKLTQSSRHGQGCSILDLKENKSMWWILRSNCFVSESKLKEKKNKTVLTLEEEGVKSRFIPSIASSLDFQFWCEEEGKTTSCCIKNSLQKSTKRKTAFRHRSKAAEEMGPEELFCTSDPQHTATLEQWTQESFPNY